MQNINMISKQIWRQLALKITISVAVMLALMIGNISSSNAQQQGEKTLLEQLEDEEEKEKKKNTHQGEVQTASKSLQKARDNAKSDATNCPRGSTRRKIEDVRAYLVMQDEIQKKFALSLERFTSKKIERNPAIDEFNKIVNERNEIVIWGQGKVTDGVCGSLAQTEIIGKAIGATKNLIGEYRLAVQ